MNPIENKNKNLPWTLGATLYSWNREYYTYEKTFEDIMEEMGSLGKGTGVELVLQQFERHYPDISPEFEARFRRQMEKYELVPTVLGGYDDPTYFDTLDDATDFAVRQIKVAHKLGFKAARILQPRRLDLTERLLPYAEKYDVVVCTEVHCPNTIESPIIQKLLEQFDKLDSPYVSFFPDCGTMCREPSDVYVTRFRNQGVKEDTIQLILDMYHKKTPEVEMIETVRRVDGSALAELMARETGEYFGQGNPEALRQAMRHIKHVHMKFFHMDENLNENAVRIPEIVKVLKEEGYTGTISSEYEGHHWFAPYSAIDQISKQHELIRRCYAEA